MTQSNGVASFSPDDPENATEFTINDITDARPIVTGPDGNLWTVSGANVIKIDPANPTGATSFPVLVAGRDIDAGKDGSSGSPTSAARSSASTPTARPRPTTPAPAPACRRSRPAPRARSPTPTRRRTRRRSAGSRSGKVKKTTSPGDPFGVAFGADKAYWIPRFAAGDLLRLTPDGQTSTLGGLANTGPRRIANGPKRTLWVTLDGAEKIAHVSGVK